GDEETDRILAANRRSRAGAEYEARRAGASPEQAHRAAAYVSAPFRGGDPPPFVDVAGRRR
ncbi:MAG: hypothetical protein EBU90_30045, partial [Proteobacteria bacterium]|nr:hypothetical protein [Pseudomonadota bacterium]